MAKNSFQFDVALGKNNYIPIGEVKQSDTMDFSIRVLENDVVKNLTGDTCTLYVSKQDGTILEQKEGINITEATSGTLTIRVKNQATACPGMTFFELEFKGADGIATSGTFLFTVNARVASGEAIQSKDEIQALEQVEKYVKEAKAELQKFKELQAAMLETNNSLNNQEELRVEAESLRVTAEEGRVAAETKREETFNEFEGRITANTEELKAARSATTGENFDSIDERIDCEVNRINKKIEISFLEQEDKESHAIENTVDGMTTDMIVKGCTLQNIMSEISIQATGATMTDTSIIIDNNDSARAGGIIFSTPLIKPNVTYTIIYNIIRNTNYQGMFKLDGHVDYPINSKDIPTTVGINKVTFTTRASFVSSNIKIATTSEIASGSLLELSKEILILEGDYTNKETLSYFKGIKSFGEQENKISILSHGLNIVDISECKRKETIDNKECWVGDGYLSGGIKNGDPIVLKLATPLKKGDTVTLISSNKATQYFNRFQFFNSATNKVQTIGTNSTLNSWVLSNFSITTDSEYDSIQINTGGIGAKSYVETLFIGIGSVLNYKPYISDKKDILLQGLNFDEGLRGLENTADELNSAKGVAIKRVEKYELTGDENWSTNSNVENEKTLYFYTDTLDNLINKTHINNIICNTLPTLSNYDSTCVLDSIFNTNGSNNIRVRISKSKLTSPDLAGFRAWLKANTTTIYYELAEPVETPLTENINAKIFDEKAYIRFENALSGTSSFKVPVNATATISRLSRENKALEAENLRLKKGTYKNSEDIILTNEELQITQSAVDHLLFGAAETAMLYNGKKKGGGSMGAYLAMRIIKGKLKYDAVMKQYGEFKEDIDLILKAEGYDHLITQQ